MELYILSKQDLSILSICKLADYQINLDEETNAKSTFTLMKTNGLKKGNYMTLNGLYRQFIFVIDDVQTEKESDVVTVTALDISNIFDRKVIEKNIDIMKSKSIEEFLANTISENFVNSDDTALNVNYIEIYWHTNTKGNVATNAENGLYNFHTFLTNCRQYKNIYTDFKLENLGNPQTVEGKRISLEAKNRKIVDISLHGESTQETRSGKNLYNVADTVAVTEGITVDEDGWITVTYDNIEGTATKFFNYFTNNLNLKTSTNYNVIAEVKNVSGTGNVNFVSVNANAKQFQSTFNKNFSVLANNTVYNSINKTTDEFVGNNGLRTYIGFSAGQSGSITFRLSVLEDTTVTSENFKYEAFGLMPSPDYTSEIENIEGNIEFKVEGKNLCNGINEGYWLTSTADKAGKTDADSGLTILVGSGKYTISTNITQTRYRIACVNELPTGTSVTAYNGVYADNTNKTITIDTTDYKYLIVNATDLSEIQIEKGETATDYEPYKSQVATFPLGEEKLMEGSYLADDGIHHKRKQVVLDGSREYIRYTSLDSANYNCFYTNQSDIYVDSTGTQTCLISNYFKGDKFDNRALDIPNMWVNKFASQIYFKVPNTITTVEELTTLFAEQYANGTPVTVEYELAEEEIVPYTTAQQEAWNNIKNLTLFEGVNHISSDANMVLKYYPLEPVGLKFVLRIDIENKQETTELIDTTLPEVADYNKIYEEDVTAKVQVYIREDGSEYNLYLKTDRTTTTNKDDPDRASGKIEVISVETADKAPEEALNVMKGNNYKHLVEFKIAKTSKLMDITKLHIRKTYKNQNRRRYI